MTQNSVITADKLRALLIAALLLLPLAAGQAATQPKGVLTKKVSVRVMPLGDSITEGKFFSQGGYRGLLQQMLLAQGYSIQYVGKEDNGQPGNDTGFSVGMTNPNHEGYGSFRIDEADAGGTEEGHSAPPIQQTLAADRPDVVLLMLGTNDVLQRHDLGGILGRLDALVGKIVRERKNVTLVLASITPLSDPRRDSIVQTYNSGIPLIVAKYQALGAHLLFADMHAALDPATDLSDGIHPTPAGYQKMANVWYAVLTGTPAVPAHP